jgi:hypothetical protein
MLQTPVIRALAVAIGICVSGTVGAQGAASNGSASQASGGKAQSAAATSTPPAPQSSQAPMGGRAFGEHVSGMAPQHAIDHRRHFGECVSAMAQGDECDHEAMH